MEKVSLSDGFAVGLHSFKNFTENEYYYIRRVVLQFCGDKTAKRRRSLRFNLPKNFSIKGEEKEKVYFMFLCVTPHETFLPKHRYRPRRVLFAARAKPTIMVGRFCGRGMGALREGILPFPEVALWFVSVDTEMNKKSFKGVFGVFVQH